MSGHQRLPYWPVTPVPSCEVHIHTFKNSDTQGHKIIYTHTHIHIQTNMELFSTVLVSSAPKQDTESSVNKVFTDLHIGKLNGVFNSLILVSQRQLLVEKHRAHYIGGGTLSLLNTLTIPPKMQQ